MRLLMLPFALASLMACGESSTAAEAQKRSQAEAAKAFEVAGVKLGDSVATAKAALEQRGFEVQIDSSSWSYEDKLNNAIAEAEGRSFTPKLNGVRSLWAIKDGERVDAKIRQTSPGGRVDGVTYTSAANGRSRAQMIEEVQGRYGRTLDNAQRSDILSICASDEPSCQARSLKRNYISFTPGDPLLINLFPGADKHSEWEAEFKAAVAAKVGPRPSSF
jgi:hypothetical protein